MSDLRGVRRVSKVMSALCLFSMLLLPTWIAIIWLEPDLFRLFAPDSNFKPESWSTTIRVIGFLISMIPSGVLIYGLFRLHRLFQRYATGQIFTTDAARHLKHFAVAILLQSLLQPMRGTALSVLLTFNNPPGKRSVTFHFGSDEIEALVIGGLLLVIAWIMGEGARIAEENRQFV